MKINNLVMAIISASIILFSCKDDEVMPQPDCELPYENLELIGESELSNEIIEENYQNYENIDSLNAFTLDLCDLGKHLIVQIVSTINEHNFTIYDSCSINIANGMFIQNNQLGDTFETSLKNELNTNITLLDLAEINFTDSVIRYIAEIRENSEEPRYLLEDDGKIICKLF